MGMKIGREVSACIGCAGTGINSSSERREGAPFFSIITSSSTSTSMGRGRMVTPTRVPLPPLSNVSSAGTGAPNKILTSCCDFGAADTGYIASFTGGVALLFALLIETECWPKRTNLKVSA